MNHGLFDNGLKDKTEPGYISYIYIVQENQKINVKINDKILANIDNTNFYDCMNYSYTNKKMLSLSIDKSIKNQYTLIVTKNYYK